MANLGFLLTYVHAFPRKTKAETEYNATSATTVMTTQEKQINTQTHKYTQHKYTHKYKSTCTQKHIHTRAYKHTHTHKNKYKNTHIHHKYKHKHKHTFTNKHRHTPTYIYVYTHTHKHKHTHTNTHTHKYTHKHTQTQTHTHKYTHKHKHTQTQTHTNTDTHTQTHTQAQIHTHKHKHTHAHTNTHKHMHAHGRNSPFPLSQKHNPSNLPKCKEYSTPNPLSYRPSNFGYDIPWWRMYFSIDTTNFATCHWAASYNKSCHQLWWRNVEQTHRRQLACQTHRRQLACQTQFSQSEYSLPSSVSDNEDYSTFLVQQLIIIFVPRNQNQRLRNKFIQKSSLGELKLESSCVSPTRNAVQNSLPDFVRL
jgi:hypothetical protein